MSDLSSFSSLAGSPLEEDKVPRAAAALVTIWALVGVFDINNPMAPGGRPPSPHPREHALFIRLSEAEHAAFERALVAEHPRGEDRPSMVEWARGVLTRHAGRRLGGRVTREKLVKRRKGSAR